MTVGEIIDAVIKKTGIQRLAHDRTCDHLMAGSLDTKVTKIVTTFMATADVIRKAIDLGADLIITHEPTWFTGKDDTLWLEGDPVYLAKKKLIEDSGIAIWRFHDHMHMDHDDGIFRGFDEEMGWASYRMAPDPQAQGFFAGRFDCCYKIPATTLGGLADFLKQKFELKAIRVIGDPDSPVERVGVLPGGGSLGLGVEYMPMQLMRRRDLDTLICGDITEWTLPAYARDAYQLGFGKSIIVLGHERSEEPGMKHLGTWMAPILGGIPVVFVDSGEPFSMH